MPVIFEAKCTRCGCIPGQTRDQVVGFDSPEGVQQDGVLIAGTTAYQTASGGIVYLPHPGGLEVLDALGIEYEPKPDDQHLLDVDYAVCSDCGTVHETYQAIPAFTTNNVLTIAASTLMFVYTRFILEARWYVILSTAFVTLVLTAFVTSKINQRRAQKKCAPYNEDKKVNNCKLCGSERLCDLFEANHQPMPCPRCGEQTMNYRVGGIS